MREILSLRCSGVLLCTALAFAGGCAREKPVTMAPPVQAPPPAAGASAEVFNWKDVPRGEQIPITRAVFDQGGYQLYARSGETIVVPFENQNMYVMKFGRTGGEMYFVNEGEAPVLYLREGMGLENASAQGARWYPFSQGHRYERPAYVGIAPSWPEFVAMGWYPGMMYYGGYWGYRPWVPGFAYAPMIGLNFNIGGRSYNGWDNYRSYYRSNPSNRYNVRSAYNYNSVGRRSASTFGRSAGGGSSFGRSAGRPAGSFGSGLGSAGRPSSSFGGSSSGLSSAGRRAGGSFGSGVSGFSSSNRSSGGSFGGGSSSRPSSSFGSGLGSASRPSSSFGGSVSRPSSSSFGGSSFGRSSGGFGSFGGGRRSGGFGGFGGRRR